MIHPLVAADIIEIRRALGDDARLEIAAEADDGSVLAVIVPTDPSEPATPLLIDPANLASSALQ